MSEAVTITAARDAGLWPAYRARWTAWNSVRGAAAPASARLLTTTVAP